MRLYLSQIREWIVEFSCDMLFISVRTDVAWYRLSQPAAKYAPWFETVLKCARLSVRVLRALSEESRASRLSFADIVRKLADTDAADATYISKKVGRNLVVFLLQLCVRDNGFPPGVVCMVLKPSWGVFGGYWHTNILAVFCSLKRSLWVSDVSRLIPACIVYLAEPT